MKIQIDVKSVLCGLAVGVAAMFVIGAGEPSNQVGRFQSAGGSGFFITIDTVTGKTWFANVSAANLTRIDGDFFDKKTLQ